MEIDNIVIPKEIDFHVLAEIENEFAKTPIEHISQTYIKNLENLIHSLTLPMLLHIKAALARTQISVTIGKAVGSAVELIKSESGNYDDLNSRVGDILSDNSTWDSEFWEKELVDNPDEYLGRARRDWLRAMSFSTVKHGYDQLLSQTVAAIWTSFETLSEDLWEQIVNDNPLTIGKRAVFSKSEENELGKVVNWNDLSSIDFEIKNKIGSLMKSKFKYSDPKKILKAYASLVDEKSFSFLVNEQLSLLAQLRHIILHNKCLVDKRFIFETHSELAIGTPYPIDESMIYQFINEVISTGQQLLREVSSVY